jgi:L-2-hydroxycarboxylate dehydrogenase (NAD+)
MIYSFEGGGILPLGGQGESHGGHKGYGLSLLVDILSGVLSGAAFGPFLVLKEVDGVMRENVGHFFGAISIDAFQEVDEFKASMDKLLRSIKESPRERAQDRIYIAGEKELEEAEERRRSGIPLHEGIVSNLKLLAEETNIKFDLVS